MLRLITWVLLRTRRRLPIGTFFATSFVLIAVLVIVLTGQGIAPLQEAGWGTVSIAPVLHIELLGIYPACQSSLAQLVILALLTARFAFNIHRGRRLMALPKTTRKVLTDEG